MCKLTVEQTGIERQASYDQCDDSTTASENASQLRRSAATRRAATRLPTSIGDSRLLSPFC